MVSRFEQCTRTNACSTYTGQGKATFTLAPSQAEAKALKSKFESIFTALCHTSAELEKAKEQVKEQFETSTSLSAENALLRQQLQGNHEEIVGGNSDASMTPLASDGSLMAPMTSDGPFFLS